MSNAQRREKEAEATRIATAAEKIAAAQALEEAYAAEQKAEAPVPPVRRPLRRPMSLSRLRSTSAARSWKPRLRPSRSAAEHRARPTPSG